VKDQFEWEDLQDSLWVESHFKAVIRPFSTDHFEESSDNI
jgi:hypothetical protein